MMVTRDVGPAAETTLAEEMMAAGGVRLDARVRERFVG